MSWKWYEMRWRRCRYHWYAQNLQSSGMSSSTLKMSCNEDIQSKLDMANDGAAPTNFRTRRQNHNWISCVRCGCRSRRSRLSPRSRLNDGKMPSLFSLSPHIRAGAVTKRRKNKNGINWWSEARKGLRCIAHVTPTLMMSTGSKPHTGRRCDMTSISYVINRSAFFARS